MNSFVVYYSRTGNTRLMAKKIAGFLDSDIEEIRDKRNRKGKFGLLKSGFEAIIGGETEIEECNLSPLDYDLVILGSPVWARKLPPAMRTYLKRHSLSNKKIALFNTNYSDESQNTFETMKKLAGKSNTVGEMVVSKISENKDELEEKVTKWCKKIQANLNMG